MCFSTIGLFLVVIIPLTEAYCFPGDKFAENIYENEKKVSVFGDTSKTRKYIMCDNGVLKKGFKTNTKKDNQDGVLELPIWNPNVHISCGINGKRENNCNLVGISIKVVRADTIDDTYETLATDNVSIQGFTFTGASDGNIFSDNSMGAKINVKDCSFYVSF